MERYLAAGWRPGPNTPSLRRATKSSLVAKSAARWTRRRGRPLPTPFPPQAPPLLSPSPPIDDHEQDLHEEQRPWRSLSGRLHDILFTAQPRGRCIWLLCLTGLVGPGMHDGVLHQVSIHGQGQSASMNMQCMHGAGIKCTVQRGVVHCLKICACLCALACMCVGEYIQTTNNTKVVHVIPAQSNLY